MTLAGTNTYLYGADPCVVIDPGPEDRGHLQVIREAAESRGGVGSILLTHGHGDHSDGARWLAIDISNHKPGTAAPPPTIRPGDGQEHAAPAQFP